MSKSIEKGARMLKTTSHHYCIWFFIFFSVDQTSSAVILWCQPLKHGHLCTHTSWLFSRGHIWETTLFAMESLGVTPSPTLPLEFFQANNFGSSVELQRVVASGRPRSQKSRTSWCSALKSSKEFSWMGGFSDITLRWVYVNMICCSNLKTIDQSCWSCQQCGFPPFGHSLLVHFRPGPHQKTNQSNNTLSSKHCKTVCWTWVVWCYLYNVILWQLMSFDVILCRLMTFNVIWCPLMLFNVIWCQLLSFDVISCHLMSFDDI